MHAPSKLNTTDDVPTTPVTVIMAVPAISAPRMPMHATDVAVVQLLVAQLACANTAVNEAYADIKPMPFSVTLAKPSTTLYGESLVITGAVKVIYREKKK